MKSTAFLSNYHTTKSYIQDKKNNQTVNLPKDKLAGIDDCKLTNEEMKKNWTQFSPEVLDFFFK